MHNQAGWAVHGKISHTGPADVTSFDLWQGVASWMEKSWKHALEC